MSTPIANSCAACTAIVVAMAGSTCLRLTRQRGHAVHPGRVDVQPGAQRLRLAEEDPVHRRAEQHAEHRHDRPGVHADRPDEGEQDDDRGQREQQFGEPADPRSTQRPCSAAASASGMPMPKATTTASSAGPTEIQLPAAMRVSTSRPSSSVPSQ